MWLGGVCSNARIRAGHEVGLPWVDSILRSNVIVTWLLCAYVREGVKRRIAGTAITLLSESGSGRREEGGRGIVIASV